MLPCMLSILLNSSVFLPIRIHNQQNLYAYSISGFISAL